MTLTIPFFSLQRWEKVVTPPHPSRRVSMEDEEETIESKPYGVDVSACRETPGIGYNSKSLNSNYHL